MKVPYDSVGDIAIFKFPRYYPRFVKKIYSKFFLRKNKHFQVCLDKKVGFSGELRIQETEFLVGDERKWTIHRENDCEFYLNVDETYFSPRLSNERKITSEEVLRDIVKKKIKNPKILILFGGIAPQAIVLAKLFKKSKISGKIISSELNKNACEFALRNVENNKVSDYVSIECGDSRELCEKLYKKKEKFTFVLMLRPNLKDTFLDSALKVCSKKTKVIYHGFGEELEVKKEVLDTLKISKKKFSKFKIRKAGDIGVRKYRWNVEFELD